MHTKITEDIYQQEIKNFIDLSIDRVNVLYAQELHVGGFSLIHIVDSHKKEGKILDIKGWLTYTKGTARIEANVAFSKDSLEEKVFQDSANKIKQEIMASANKLVDIVFTEESSGVVLTFADSATLTVKTSNLQMKPLSYDDDTAGYVVYFGEAAHRNDNFYYFKMTKVD